MIFSCNIVIGAKDLLGWLRNKSYNTVCVESNQVHLSGPLRLNLTRMELLFSVSIRKKVPVRPDCTSRTPPINVTNLRPHTHSMNILFSAPLCDCSVVDWCSTDRLLLFTATAEWRRINLSSAAQCSATKTPTDMQRIVIHELSLLLPAGRAAWQN